MTDRANAQSNRQRRPKKLDAYTLRCVAKELRQSEKNCRAQAKRAARLGAYGLAADDKIWAQALALWATHFEGQAKRVAVEP